jgi:hypothetical protein
MISYKLKIDERMTPWAKTLLIWNREIEKGCPYRSSWYKPMIVWRALQSKGITTSHRIPKLSHTRDAGRQEVFKESK